MERDFVNIDMYHEVILCQKLGYSVFCKLEGITGEMVVDDARMIGGDGRNLEVLTIYGWKRPAKCWAIGPASSPVKPEPSASERRLF